MTCSSGTNSNSNSFPPLPLAVSVYLCHIFVIIITIIFNIMCSNIRTTFTLFMYWCYSEIILYDIFIDHGISFFRSFFSHYQLKKTVVVECVWHLLPNNTHGQLLNSVAIYTFEITKKDKYIAIFGHCYGFLVYGNR